MKTVNKRFRYTLLDMGIHVDVLLISPCRIARALYRNAFTKDTGRVLQQSIAQAGYRTYTRVTFSLVFRSVRQNACKKQVCSEISSISCAVSSDSEVCRYT